MAKHFIATRIPENTFKGMQLNAGVMLKRFDINNPTEIKDEDIICATTGGFQINCKPTYTDLGEDVDNCPKNIKYNCLKLKEVLQCATTRAKPPVTVIRRCPSFTLCADVVRQMCAKKRRAAW